MAGRAGERATLVTTNCTISLPPGCGTVRHSRRFLLKEADRLVGDDAGYLVIDDTALPRKGQHLVGVAPQYASSLGKTSNCPSLVSVTLASREVPVMVGLRLFLPESWTDDPERMKRARVPLD
jgi:SRSO17 transposase